MTDLSLIVTAHSETAVAGPTMRSADAAVAAARARGFSVEQILALDKATDETTAYFGQSRFDHWDRRVKHAGDLGLVRNQLVGECDGDVLAFLDADDLFSENWLAEAMETVTRGAARGERLIAHSELQVLFDRNIAVVRNVEQTSTLFTPYYLYLRSYYDSLCVSPREAHLEVPYVSRDIPRGLAYQDFQYSIETMSRGWQHVIVPDTIIFKRRRDESLLTQSAARRALIRSLPEMAIDRVRALNTRGH